MTDAPENDPSIDKEPHLSGKPFQGDRSEEMEELKEIDRGDVGDDARVENTVWDEPGLSRELAGETPEDGLTYSRWLEARIREGKVADSWLMVLWITVTAGPIGVATAFYEGSVVVFPFLHVTVFGPLVEEIGKIAFAIWVVEKRPFLFRSRFQIAICAAAGGLLFAVVENLIYFSIYIPDATEGIIAWRWSVCVVLHVGCSLIASLGLMRIWSQTMTNLTPPDLPSGARYIILAIVIHGAYNGFCILLELSDFKF